MLISKKKIVKIIKELEADSADQSKASGDTTDMRMKDFYWRCGNANAVNYIKYKLKL